MSVFFLIDLSSHPSPAQPRAGLPQIPSLSVEGIRSFSVTLVRKQMLLYHQGPWGAWREPLSWTAGVSLSGSVPLEQECPCPMVGVSPGLSLGWGR